MHLILEWKYQFRRIRKYFTKIKRKICKITDYSCTCLFSYPTLFLYSSLCFLFKEKVIRFHLASSWFVGTDRFRGLYCQTEESKYLSSLKKSCFLTDTCHRTESSFLLCLRNRDSPSPFHNVSCFIFDFRDEIPRCSFFHLVVRLFEALHFIQQFLITGCCCFGGPARDAAEATMRENGRSDGWDSIST